MRAPIAVVLVGLVLTTGCLGSVTPASIPDPAVQEADWEETTRSEESVAMGLGQIVTIEYHPQQNSRLAGVAVATANDVPILDETRFIGDALEDVEAQYNIELTETGSEPIQLANLGTGVDATLYRVEDQSSPGEGKAILFVVPCDDFVVVIGWGPHEESSRFLGEDVPSYQDARSLARQVAC